MTAECDRLICGDCLEVMPTLPDNSVDLVLTDPPYNIGVETQSDNKRALNGWDKIDDYINWCVVWLKECQRILKPNGVLYFWHNDIVQMAQLLEAIRTRTDLAFMSFCIWDKGNGYRAQSWHNRRPDGATAPRSWFNICEYCLHFFNAPRDADSSWRHTGLDRINSNPECYKPIKEWYRSECERLGLTRDEIAAKYTEVTGRKPYMLRHYFNDNQFEIPTREVWDTVYVPLGFSREYEELRREYEELRNYHRCDAMHCNVWHVPPIPSNNRYHTCQKPIEILERLINVSCRAGGVVLDCFMGSGSTGVACANTGRRFIGIERDEGYYRIARERIAETIERCQ